MIDLGQRFECPIAYIQPNGSDFGLFSRSQVESLNGICICGWCKPKVNIDKTIHTDDGCAAQLPTMSGGSFQVDIEFPGSVPTVHPRRQTVPVGVTPYLVVEPDDFELMPEYGRSRKLPPIWLARK